MIQGLTLADQIIKNVLKTELLCSISWSAKANPTVLSQSQSI